MTTTLFFWSLVWEYQVSEHTDETFQLVKKLALQLPIKKKLSIVEVLSE